MVEILGGQSSAGFVVEIHYGIVPSRVLGHFKPTQMLGKLINCNSTGSSRQIPTLEVQNIVFLAIP